MDPVGVGVISQSRAVFRFAICRRGPTAAQLPRALEALSANQHFKHCASGSARRCTYVDTSGYYRYSTIAVNMQYKCTSYRGHSSPASSA